MPVRSRSALRNFTTVVSLAATACAGGSAAAPQGPVSVDLKAAPVAASEQAPDGKQFGERLDLNLLMPAQDGDSLVAWSSLTTDAGKRLLCGIRLSTKTAYCNEEAPEIAVKSVSAKYVVLTTPGSLVVREVFSSRVVAELALEKPVLHAALSPDERHVALFDEAGQGRLLRLDDGRLLSAATVSAPISAGDYEGVRGSGVEWISAQRVVFSGRGAPTLMSVPSGGSSEATSTRLAIAASASCSRAAPFEDALLVVACYGQVGLFDPTSGAEKAQLQSGTRYRGMRAVSLRTVGKRVLVHYQRFGAPNHLELFEPLASKPLLWSESGDVSTADLRADGRIGWQIYRELYGGPELQAFEKDLTSEPRRLEGTFLAWSGKNVVVEEESVKLRVDGRSVFAHYASWAPEANTERRGRFLWVSGGSSMVRIADGDAEPLVFDVFGSVKAPLVKRVAPTLPPPRSPARADDGVPPEAWVGGAVEGSEVRTNEKPAAAPASR